MTTTATVTSSRLLAWTITVSGLLCWCSALRDVMLVVPPVARAGSSVTLRCLYDLEGDKLYSVKWYRGNFEFYRATPHEEHPKQAFPYPDFNVDLSQSDEHQVTLRRVPLHMSGTFACEVTRDSPTFLTVVKKAQLLVLDTVRRPILTVSQDLYRPGDELVANCTMPSASSAEPLPALSHEPHTRHPHFKPQLLPDQPPIQPHLLTAEQRRHLQKEAEAEPPLSFGFWVNNKPVPASMVLQSPSSAMMIRPVAEADFSAQGELRLKCVATLADKYREPSHVVTVRRQEDEEEEEEEEEEEKDEVEETPVVVTEAHPAFNAVDAPLPDTADRSTGAGAGAAASASLHSWLALPVVLVTAAIRMELNNLRIRLAL